MLPCLLFPAVRFAWVFQPFLSGPCFLYELHSSVVPFPLWSALPPLSTMKRSDSLTPFRLSSFCWTVLPAWSGDIRGLPSSWRFSFSVPCSLTPTGLQGSRLALNANLCSATMRFRSLCIGFRFPNVVATCICSYEAELLQEGANFLTAHRIPCVRFVWVVRLCVSPSQSRNTQYGWLAMPLPMRTFTSSENVKLRLAH